jgi:hypothetical protein
LKRRNFFHAGLSLAGAAVLSAAALAAPANATTTTSTGATEACDVATGSVTATGAHTMSGVTAGTPPVKGGSRDVAGVFQPGKVRVASTYSYEPNISGGDISGYVIQGDSLYSHYYWQTGSGEIDPSTPNSFKRIGGGWTNFTAVEEAYYEQGSYQRVSTYGLRNDGTLFRWTPGTVWRSTGSTPGFGSVKSIALISKTRTYDTFLANTRGGALYTIRIPATAPMKPIVTALRSTGFGSYEKLIADRCGQYGTLLLGIDKDGKTSNLYAVGHTNGTATVINDLGKVSGGTFPDPVDFRWGPVNYQDQLNGD